MRQVTMILFLFLFCITVHFFACFISFEIWMVFFCSFARLCTEPFHLLSVVVVASVNVLEQICCCLAIWFFVFDAIFDLHFMRYEGVVFTYVFNRHASYYLDFLSTLFPPLKCIVWAFFVTKFIKSFRQIHLKWCSNIATIEMLLSVVNHFWLEQSNTTKHLFANVQLKWCEQTIKRRNAHEEQCLMSLNKWDMYICTMNG